MNQKVDMEFNGRI